VTLHHVEVWVPSLERAEQSWGWLMPALGWSEFQRWERGVSWRRAETYLVLEQSPALTADEHDRCRPGLNHLAFHAGTATDVDGLVEQAPAHGWELMFADRHPHAGGPDVYAAYLCNGDGYEVELVAGGNAGA
jgi:catechol 2,3-dioxygenase-like lactoylglutathione lyase family enzyme